MSDRSVLWVADGLVEEILAARDDEVRTQNEQDGRTTLTVPAAGLAAIGIEEGDGPAPTTKGDAGTKMARRQDSVIALLRRGQGASVEEIMEATGWRAHSVRSFMSGAPKRRRGLDVVSEKDPKTGKRGYYVAAGKSS